MAEVLKDKVQQVLNKAFPMVDAYLDYLNSHRNINPKQDISVLESFLFSLLDKLVDSKQYAKVQASYEHMFNIPQFDCPFLIAFLFKPQQFSNKFV